MIIGYVTGSRADYELIRPLLEELSEEHIIKIYSINKTSKIDEEHKKVDESIMLPELIRHFNKEKHDYLMIEGDRPEALISATAAVMTGTKIIHLSGGDLSGHRDNKIRYAISSLADIHLPGTSTSAKRLINKGFNPEKIFVTGHLMNTETVIKKELDDYMGFNVNKKTIIIIFHSSSGQEKKSFDNMNNILKAISDDEEAVIILPNNDPGFEGILKCIKKYEMKKNFHIYKNIPGKIFSTLMRHSGFMIGNSSAGITEAPHWKLPVINVGDRQKGRERADNIIDVDGDTKEILSAINKINNLKMKNNPYNQVGTVELIKRIINDLKCGTND